MNEPKTYINSITAKEVKFQSTGNSVLKLSFKVEALIEFLNQHKNEKGYVNVGVSRRKEVGKYGETHTVWLDTWKPDPNRQRQPQPEAPKEEQPDKPADDVPF